MNFRPPEMAGVLFPLIFFAQMLFIRNRHPFKLPLSVIWILSVYLVLINASIITTVAAKIVDTHRCAH